MLHHDANSGSGVEATHRHCKNDSTNEKQAMQYTDYCRKIWIRQCAEDETKRSRPET